DHGHCRILRARRQWPRHRCTAEQRDEVAPFHSRPSLTMVGSDYQMIADAASQRAEVRNVGGHIRLSPRPPKWRSGASGSPPDTGSPVCAINSPEQLQQGVCTEVAYSITSPARAKSDGGTVMPSALAVFILMTRSSLFGCSTGRSPGFSPLRTLSTKLA